MLVTKNEQLAEQLLDELMEEINEDREGMHPSVTDLIGCLTRSYYDAQTSKAAHTTKTKLYFLIGLGLERALLVKRKGVSTYGVTEGVHWHVDSIDHGLLEMKSTRANPARGSDGFSERWLKQIKSYLKATGGLDCDLVIVYLIQPAFEVFRLSFTQVEIDTHWAWMMKRKWVWEEHQNLGTSPKAFTYNEPWECRDCAYKLICETKQRMGL